MLSHYSLPDLVVFIAYGFLLVVSGWYFNRRTGNAGDYFLGGHAMPVWAVAVSVLATSQSAATFIGGPDQGYRNDLTYITTTLGALLAAFFVARYFIPKFYQYRVFTVYGLLSHRYGGNTAQMAGAVYILGRVFASGARLYMAAIAVSMILFGDIQAMHVVLAVVLITVTGLLYTIVGGIRTVIFSDVLQAIIYISAAIAVIIALLITIPADWHDIVNALHGGGQQEQVNKLRWLNTELDFSPSGVFSIWSILTGFVLLNIAAFGLDQDMTQRMLTCKNAKAGSRAMYLSVWMTLPVMLLFIVIGLLLYVYYQQPSLMQSHVNSPSPTFSGAPVTVFMFYVLTTLPAGVKGLVTIGIVAAALSTLNSGLNSMASVLVKDFYQPWSEKHTAPTANASAITPVFAGKVAMFFVATALGAMACLCFYWQQYSDLPLLQFALGVMVFSYSGLLGVYFSALFTQRGNARSVAYALVVGFIVPLLCQPYVMQYYLPVQWHFSLGFTWQLIIGTVCAFFVCQIGRQPHSSSTITA